MSEIVWDQIDERVFETGVDHGVLYLPDNNGVYVNGVPWNGLTAVNQSPTGAESNKQYADNMAYLNLVSVEEFAATIECLTVPREFYQFDGLATPTPGLMLGQQNRNAFGFSWRVLKGNPLQGTKLGYKIHLAYGCLAAPSEKSNATISDTPEPVTMSYALTTSPVPVPNYDPTALVIIDSTEVGEDELAAVELILYGTSGVDPRLPLPEELITIFSTGITSVVPSEPAFNSGTNTITIPTVVGVVYKIGGEIVPAGAVVITEDTLVRAEPVVGYYFPDETDDDWGYEYTP